MAHVVSVLTVAPGVGSNEVWDLDNGETLDFGTCRCGGCRRTVTVYVPGPAALRGRIVAHLDHWRVDNPGPTSFLVEDLEQPHNTITVVAGRAAVVIPFELGRVRAGAVALLTVFGPEPAAVDVSTVPACPSDGARDAGDLTPGTGYFEVLRVLCEPRLRGEVHRPLATSAEIAATLTGRGSPISARAVDAHICYLVGKLGLAGVRDGLRAHRSWRKEALVSAALRWGLVGPQHLP